MLHQLRAATEIIGRGGRAPFRAVRYGVDGSSNRGLRGRGSLNDKSVTTGCWGVEGEELFGGGESSTRGFGRDKAAVEVGEHTRFHGFTTVVATARDERRVNGVVGLIEPFAFAFATVSIQSAKTFLS